MFDVICGIIETRLAKCIIAKRQSTVPEPDTGSQCSTPVASRYESINRLLAKILTARNEKKDFRWLLVCDG